MNDNPSNKTTPQPAYLPGLDPFVALRGKEELILQGYATNHGRSVAGNHLRLEFRDEKNEHPGVAIFSGETPWSAMTAGRALWYASQALPRQPKVQSRPSRNWSRS